jgi:long-chain acyl-CoA synthetase
VKIDEHLTLADLPFRLAERYPKSACICRCREDGLQEFSSQQFYEHVRDLSLAFSARGLAPGDRVAVISESRPEWGIADLASITAGGVTVPIYPTQSADQVHFILCQAGVKFAAVSSPAQVEKIARVRQQLPALQAIILMDGEASIDGFPVLKFTDLVAEGRAIVAADPQAEQRYRQASEAVDRHSLATIVYTSGTTGEPKGVMLTHANIMSNVLASDIVCPTTSADTALSFLPMSHVFERMAFYRYLYDGVTVVFAESLTTVARDLERVKPTIMTGVPRVYEKFHAAIQEKLRASSALQVRIFRWALGVGMARSKAEFGRQTPSPWVRLQHALADRLVFRKIRARVGGRIRYLISGSAPLSLSIGEFFHAIGLRIIEGYGLTETSPVLTSNPLDGVRFGTVGKPMPGIEIRIAPDGEILARGPNVMIGYYKRPDLTAEVIKDGWFHTGDIGEIDQDGYLTITDRKKDLIVTSGGKKIAPQPLENQLKADLLVAEAVIVGEQRKFPAALIVPDFAALEAQVRRMNLGALARAELVKHPEVLALYQALLDALNEKLAQFERVKRFALLPTEFTMERGELTPTMKVRRQVVEERWRDLIEGLYASTSGAWHAAVPDAGT